MTVFGGVMHLSKRLAARSWPHTDAYLAVRYHGGSRSAGSSDYRYTVNGQDYIYTRGNGFSVPQQISISYNPTDPRDTISQDTASVFLAYIVPIGAAVGVPVWYRIGRSRYVK